MMSIKSWVAWPGAPIALASAALFGASTPLAKALLGGGISPWLLAGLLYLGSGIGLALITVLLRLVGRASSEAPLDRRLAMDAARHPLGRRGGAGPADARAGLAPGFVGGAAAQPGRARAEGDRLGSVHGNSQNG